MTRTRNLGFLSAVALLLAVSTVSAPAASAATLWWVDNAAPNCSNTGPGISDTPLCTISAAATKAVNAGDQVMVRPGTYAEQVTVAASGAPGSPITFTASAPGVVVSGTRDLSDVAGWTATTGTAWSRPYAPSSAPRQVFRDSARLGAAASLASLTAGQFFYDGVARVLYVDAGGANPATGHTIEAGAQTYGFNVVGRSNVVVDGFTARRQNSAGVRLSGSSASTVQNVTATQAGINGILLEASTFAVTVSSSTVSGAASVGIKLSATTGSRVVGNTSRGNGLHGISLATSTNNVIEGNESADNLVTSGTNTAAGIDVNTTSPDNIVRGNLLHGNQDSGIQVYNTSHRALVVRNISYGNGDHGFDTFSSNNVTYLSNTSYGNRKDGFSVEGNSTGASLRNNIAVDNGLSTAEFDVYVDGPSATGFTADSDQVWNSANAVAVKIGLAGYRTLAAYAAATGQEARGSSLDPSFAGSATGDFALAVNSPAIDSADASVTGFEPTDRTGTSATNDPNVPDTGAGTPPYADRGALERTPLAGDPADSAPHAVLVLAPSTAQVPPATPITADASGSSDPDATGVLSYTFDFGDGATVGPQPQSTATHAFASVGARVVTVSVTDSAGQSGTATQTVTLTQRPLVDYQVDRGNPACSDAGDGTSTPFCTIGRAAAVAKAGDVVSVHPGSYREQVTPVQGGESGAPLTFRATAAGVRVMGSTDVSDAAGWTATSTTAWSRALPSTVTVNQVFSDGQRLTAATGSNTTTPGSFFYDSSAGRLYVDAGGPNPATGHTLEASTRTYGFKLWSTSDVVLDGIAMWGQVGSGVSTQDSVRISVVGVTAEAAGSSGISSDRSTALTVSGSTALANASIGIRLATTSGSTVANNVAHDNLFHGISLQGSPTNVVSGNTAYANARPSVRSATGIDISAGSTDVVVERNTVYANQDSGIEIYTGSDNATVRRNLAYDNGDHGLDCLGSSGDRVIGNTAVGNATAGINLEGGCPGSTVMDNLSSDNAVGSTRTIGDIRLDEATVPGSVVDRNVVFMTNGGPLYEWNSAPYSTLAAFRAASGQETAGLGADPRFVDATSRDLRLTGHSPALDNADVSVAGASVTDLRGAAPVDVPAIANTGAGSPPYVDRGALEYAGPSAALAVAPGSGTVPLTVTADASASTVIADAISSYAFDCGNGTAISSSSAPRATCSYPLAGTFTVTVTVTDTRGLTDAATATVSTAVDQPPIAALSATPSSGVAPLTVSLDASGSHDPEGGALSYTFACGNGTIVGPQPAATATCTYAGAKSYLASVTVTDPGGKTGTASLTVVVTVNQAPAASMTVTPSTDYVPAPGSPPTTLVVDASGSSDPEGGALTYAIDCGNGTAPANTVRATCGYSVAGSPTIRLTVTDPLGRSGATTKKVTIKADAAPVVNLAPLPAIISSGDRVTVDASTSVDPDHTPIATYRTECGNGQVIGPVSSPTATCVYPASGKFTIRVTATDTSTIGLTGVATANLRVR